MKRILFVFVMLLVFAGCGRKQCASLARQACEMAPGTPACERATRMTAEDECAGFNKDVARYVELMNMKVTTPGVQPPARPAADATEPQGQAAPAAGAPQAAPSAGE